MNIDVADRKRARASGRGLFVLLRYICGITHAPSFIKSTKEAQPEEDPKKYQRTYNDYKINL